MPVGPLPQALDDPPQPAHIRGQPEPEPEPEAPEEHAPTPPAATPAEPREYIVFEDAAEPSQETRWLEVGRATATTKTAARDEIVDKLPENERDGPFVTIAASAWKPQKASEERDVKPGRTTIRRVWS